MSETRGRDATGSVRRQARSFGFETMEGRTLLSSAVASPTGPSTHAEIVQPRKEHRQEVRAEVAAREQTQVVANYNAALNSKSTIAKQVKFGINTWVTAHKLVLSTNVAQTAWNFTKLSVSHDTRKVGAAYIKAFLKGDGHTLDQLGNTKVVKNIGQEYTDIAHSTVAKKISQGFTHFGVSVAKQFNHLFGL